MAHASRPRQSRRTGRTRGRRREAGRFGCRSFDPMPGYRAARGTARAVFARPAPRPGSRRSALCARVPRRHGRHGWCPPARSQDQDQARPGVPPPRPTRHRAARFVYPAAASRLRSDRPRAAGAGSVRPCRRYPVRNGFRGAPATGTRERDRRAGHDSLPRIHVRVTKRARRATEIELSAALTLTVQRPPQQHPGQTKPPTHARQQAHTRRGIRTGAQSPRYV